MDMCVSTFFISPARLQLLSQTEPLECWSPRNRRWVRTRGSLLLGWVEGNWCCWCSCTLSHCDFETSWKIKKICLILLKNTETHKVYSFIAHIVLANYVTSFYCGMLSFSVKVKLSLLSCLNADISKKIWDKSSCVLTNSWERWSLGEEILIKGEWKEESRGVGSSRQHVVTCSLCPLQKKETAVYLPLHTLLTNDVWRSDSEQQPLTAACSVVITL